MAEPSKRRVLMLGATGTIGRATARELARQGHDVTCLVRSSTASLEANLRVRRADLTDPTSLVRDGIAGERFDVLVSCLASRNGTPRDAWAIDHDAHVLALDAASKAGVTHMVLLSAICVQRPMLAFQHAKLAFEEKLMASGLGYSIVRPTAFFKSLSGQVERVMKGKPFLVFGDGRLTSCKPISDGDLARFIARCLDDENCLNRILPIGGPGPAITPLDQAHAIFKLLGRQPKISHVPVKLLDVIIAGLSLAGHVSAKMADKAELARIGRYYATQSMLVFDPTTGRYDADATPSTGSETLFDYYERLIRGETTLDRGAHAVF